MTVMREVLEVGGHQRPGSPVPEFTIVGENFSRIMLGRSLS